MLDLVVADSHHGERRPLDPDPADVICIGGRKPKGGDTERSEDCWN